MKVSLNWAQEFSNVDLKSMGREELLRKIGAQLGAVEEVIDFGARYDGVVVARIAKCEKHPDADKLSVCWIDDGGAIENVERHDNLVQVVCGALNVREGLLVAWLPPGSTVPSSHDDKEPFVLGARELRGVVSNGMLASPKELGLGDQHDGILEIDEDVQPGTPFKKLYDLDDFVIDCENKMFTHRPDCFGILGVARELAGIQQQHFASPDWYTHEPSFEERNNLPFYVRSETDQAPRFMAVALENIAIKSSSLWLRAALVRVGLKPINNVVDITNYVMHLTGQPLHAYDYDKIAERSGETPTLLTRNAHDGEKVALLNGKTIELDDQTMVIATDKEVVGLAGVMGGSDTEVDENTSRIILEVATFDMYAIRRTSMKHGLFTDAVTRFNKGQSFRQNDRVLGYAMRLLGDIANGVQASQVFDERRGEVSSIPTITTGVDFVNIRLGSKLSIDEMARLLENVEFHVEKNDNTLQITPPFWRQDIEIAEDIVEEIGRLYGFDKLPVALPKRDLTPAELEPMLAFKKRLRRILSAAGANEVVTYSFVHGDLLKKVGQNPEDSYKLRNALSPELQYYRQSLTPSLLTHLHPNIKAGHDEFALFEMNKTHNKVHGLDDEEVPGEIDMLALVYASKLPIRSPYYHARYYLDYLAARLGLTLIYKAIDTDPDFPVTRPFDHTRSALVTDKSSGVFIGMVGEYRTEVLRNLKLPSTAGFEISPSGLLEAIQKDENAKYRPLSRYPGTEQDICLKVSTSISYAATEDVFRKVLQTTTYEWSLSPVDIYQRDDNREHKQVTIRVKLADPEKTMTAEAVREIVQKIVDHAAQKLNAEYI